MIEYILGGCVVLSVLDAIAGGSEDNNSGKDYTPPQNYDYDRGYTSYGSSSNYTSYEGPREFNNVP